MATSRKNEGVQNCPNNKKIGQLSFWNFRYPHTGDGEIWLINGKKGKVFQITSHSGGLNNWKEILNKKKLTGRGNTREDNHTCKLTSQKDDLTKRQEVGLTGR